MTLECSKGESDSLRLILVPGPKCESEVEMFGSDEKVNCDECGAEVTNRTI